jgi:hypothetical protein
MTSDQHYPDGLTAEAVDEILDAVDDQLRRDGHSVEPASRALWWHFIREPRSGGEPTTEGAAEPRDDHEPPARAA